MVGHKLSNPITQVFTSLLMQHFYSYPTMKAFLFCFQRLPWLPFTIWDHRISLDAGLKKQSVIKLWRDKFDKGVRVTFPPKHKTEG